MVKRGTTPGFPRRRWFFGLVDANTSVADLEKRFGSENVRRAQINLGECETTDGTIVYPEDSVRRVDVVWKDESRRGPAFECSAKSDWGIAPGMSLGMSLKEIER